MTTREKAINWWNKLSLESKFYEVIPWLTSKDLGAAERHPNNLTGREIEELYRISESKSSIKFEQL